MEYAALILAGAQQQLHQLFNHEEPDKTLDLDELHHKVASMVLHLLGKDLGRLLHILYRIDVAEHQVKQAMLLPSHEEVAEQLARLIIKRELQKAQTRFIYRSN
jgi:hypothetical protein